MRFYGPDESRSRQWLEARESTAFQNRRHLKSVLEHDGVAALRKEILAFLHHELSPSPENQRLADIYRNQGMGALIDELNRF
jgi:hypothetical protein